MRRRTVRITKNFGRNLDEIRRFLDKQEIPGEFQLLLERVFETVIPNLERFPEIGVDFLAKTPQSTEGRMHLEILKQRLGTSTSVREYISGDYLVLYASRGNNVYLLSIKHHRQLSFDLKGHWS